MNNACTLERKKRQVALMIYGVALAYFLLKIYYYQAYVGGFPDQEAQLSYVIEMCRQPSILPDFAGMTMWTTSVREGGRQIIARMPGTVCYLGHPPVYYLLMAATGSVQILADGQAAVDVARLYLANILLSGAGAVLAFRLGYRRLKDRGPVVHAVYAVAIATLPELGYVSASVNNDNLAFFAFALFFTGLFRYDGGKVDGKTYALIGIGFLLGGFSKLTAAMMMLVCLGVVLVMSVVRTRSLKLVANKYFLMTVPCYLALLVYETAIYRRYGTFQPGLAVLAPEYFFTTILYVAPEKREALSLFQYARKFLQGIGYTWSSLYGHNAEADPIMNNRVYGLVYWVPVGTAGVLALGQMIRRKADRYTIPVCAAFIGTLGYHFCSCWSGFLKNGYLGGMQARYYMPLMIGFAMAMCEQVPPLLKTRGAKRAGTILAAALMICWLAGDAPRLAILYGFPAIP